MKLNSNDLFKILMIIVVASVLGYFLGIYMFFMHTAYEIFYYALYYGTAFVLYFLGSWVVSTIQEKTQEDIAVKEATNVANAVKKNSLVDAVLADSPIRKTIDSLQDFNKTV